MATEETSRAADSDVPAGAAKPPRSIGDIVKKALQAVVGIAIAATLLIWLLPKLLHTTWAEVGDDLSLLGPGKALLLAGMMLVGLYIYTFTLSASLPGLKHAPALMVNLCGSGVSNSMPGGGAVGAAAQYGIFRSWGFSHRNIGTSLIITSIWNLLVRALLPVGAVAWLVLSGTTNLPKQLVYGVLAAVVLALILVGLAVGILASDKGAHRIGRGLNKVVRPLLKLLHKEQTADVEAIAVDIRARIIDVIRPGWFRLTFGVVGFLGVYFFLFRECLLAFGIDLPWAQAFACYALSRMLTMVPLTPGGIGVTEMAALAIAAFGASGGSAFAAVFLFAVYSHLLEIPAGLIAAGAWRLTLQRYQVHEVDGPDDAPDHSLPAFH